MVLLLWPTTSGYKKCKRRHNNSGPNSRYIFCPPKKETVNHVSKPIGQHWFDVILKSCHVVITCDRSEFLWTTEGALKVLP